MAEPASIGPQLLHSEQITDKKPWDRQEQESARWFLRFRNYLNLGLKRSINATFEAEHQADSKEKQGKTRTKCGPEWYNAAKRYQWAERAKAWDTKETERKARLMHYIVAQEPFVSRPFRITQLNSMAESLMHTLEKGCEAKLALAITKQLQSLMHDIADEIAAWEVTVDASCDAFALESLKAKQQRMTELYREQEKQKEAELDAKIADFERRGLIDRRAILDKILNK